MSKLMHTVKMNSIKVVSASKKALTAFIILLTTFPQTANALAESTLAKGTEQLLQDATSWLMIIVPAVTVLVVIYYLIRRAAADEMEHKKCCARKFA